MPEQSLLSFNNSKYRSSHQQSACKNEGYGTDAARLGKLRSVSISYSDTYDLLHCFRHNVNSHDIVTKNISLGGLKLLKVVNTHVKIWRGSTSGLVGCEYDSLAVDRHRDNSTLESVTEKLFNIGVPLSCGSVNLELCTAKKQLLVAEVILYDLETSVHLFRRGRRRGRRRYVRGILGIKRYDIFVFDYCFCSVFSLNLLFCRPRNSYVEWINGSFYLFGVVLLYNKIRSVTLNSKISITCLVGGNGTGKTTALSLISGLNTPYRGDVLIKGQSISKIKNLYDGLLGVLPQNPQSVFVKKTVYLDLMEILSDKKLTKEEKEQKVHNISVLCRIENLLKSHPYDLSGGEQQRAALAKILLMEPEILLLDEPTKGMDAHFKEEFADILMDLKSNGVTTLMVSHDIEFCAEYADRCTLCFDGSITSASAPREFFKGKNFYTTSANRMARTRLPDAVLAEDIILACGGKIEKRERQSRRIELHKAQNEIKTLKKRTKKLTPARIILGSIFALLFALTSLSFITDIDILGFSKVNFLGLDTLQIIAIIEIAIACFCFFPQRDIGIEVIQVPKSDRKLTNRTLMATFLILLLIPLTIYIGVFFLGDRKYYFISLLIILETMIPFCMVFESRKPKARELIVISVLCTIAVAGRAAFFMLPQFTPVVALVIIAGVCFGGETGFLVGAVTGFVSNFFFGQGPWTPWQMFAFGIIGFIAGILFKKGLLRKTKSSLCIFGFLATFIIYGGIMNPSSVIMWQSKITWDMIKSAYIMGIPFDLIHALGTAFFLWFISGSMIDKLERIKVKYGLVER